MPAGAVEGTVAQAADGWGGRGPGELADLLEAATRQLQTRIEEAALDAAAYWRQYWDVWGGLAGSGESVAAMNRHCEYTCRALDQQRLISEALRDAQRERVLSLRAVIGAGS